MNQIQKLTQVIRDNSECELDYGTLRTLKMIDNESIKTEDSAMCEADSNALLCEVCAYWLEDSEFKGMGACGSDDVNNKLAFGHADYFLISADFGCKFFKKK
jgi:hypothetical protein